MNYCAEDELHAIKLMADVYLRKIRMSLLLVGEMSTFFSGVSLYAVNDSGKF